MSVFSYLKFSVFLTATTILLSTYILFSNNTVSATYPAIVSANVRGTQAPVISAPTSIPSPTPSSTPTPYPTHLPTLIPTVVHFDKLSTSLVTDPSAPPQYGVIGLINTKRSEVGLSALVSQDQLTVAAKRHSEDAVRTGRCDHAGSDGSDFSRRAQDAGFSGAYGETIACGTTSAEQTVQLWWDSPGHHAILTNGSVSKIGVAETGGFTVAVVGF